MEPKATSILKTFHTYGPMALQSFNQFVLLPIVPKDVPLQTISFLFLILLFINSKNESFQIYQFSVFSLLIMICLHPFGHQHIHSNYLLESIKSMCTNRHLNLGFYDNKKTRSHPTRQNENRVLKYNSISNKSQIIHYNMAECTENLPSVLLLTIYLWVTLTELYKVN